MPPVNRVPYMERRFAANERCPFSWSVGRVERLRGFRFYAECKLALMTSLSINGIELLAHDGGAPLEVLSSAHILYPPWKPGQVLTLCIWNTSYEPAIIRVRPLVVGDERDFDAKPAPS